ncbi:RraA family protein [Effusibacillus lacus]|uniref:Putative 4-hydroxy-4-methyl-2-oxoglutarate aldolase n=1 Tax=Effusibacillus lacus TaxID=1348429 RepID=A0A292YMU8_9BACL|nr:RraA family protein [Effusibacillus lacus]TCS67849.1 RraA family protein [Effusibacillus lacus]GAX89825.1 methyltransferase [Effusibacillus lacus]
MPNIGFRIFPAVRKASTELLRQYRDFVTPHLSDNMNRLNAVDARIRPIHASGKLVGSAFTVKTRPGDNLMIHKAIDMAGPGDVIVVDAGGDLTNAIIGEIMVRLAKKNGVEGFVIDGAVRDYEAIRELNYPVYAKGIIHRGPYKDGPGEINVPIQIGGAVVNPGDIVVGDLDGVVVVPFEQAEFLIGKVKTTMEMEKSILDSIENGSVDRGWVDELLRKKGCEGV